MSNIVSQTPSNLQPPRRKKFEITTRRPEIEWLKDPMREYFYSNKPRKAAGIHAFLATLAMRLQEKHRTLTRDELLDLSRQGKLNLQCSFQDMAQLLSDHCEMKTSDGKKMFASRQSIGRWAKELEVLGLWEVCLPGGRSGTKHLPHEIVSIDVAKLLAAVELSEETLCQQHGFRLSTEEDCCGDAGVFPRHNFFPALVLFEFVFETAFNRKGTETGREIYRKPDPRPFLVAIDRAPKTMREKVQWLYRRGYEAWLTLSELGARIISKIDDRVVVWT